MYLSTSPPYPPYEPEKMKITTFSDMKINVVPFIMEESKSTNFELSFTTKK